MKNENPIIDALARYGYFYAPESLLIDDVSGSIDKLTMGDQVVHAALQVYQETFAHQLNSLARHYHRREAHLDGEPGPATHDLLVLVPRCGVPDYAHPDEEAARFPDSCVKEITTSYRMDLAGLSADTLERLWKEADQNWANALEVDFIFQPDKYPNTNIYSAKRALGGSTLAWQVLSQGRCGDRLEGAFDNRTWNEVLFVTTCTHEHGHALGLGHVTSDRTATMYPSITNASMARRGAPNESDIKALLSLGYDRRTTPVPPPAPPDGPTPPSESFATIVPTRSIEAGKRYLIVPESAVDGGWRF